VSHQGPGERRLARTVRTHQGVDLPRPNREIDPSQDLLPFGRHVEVADLEQGSRRHF
jgi:hypothetical protein